ncbi:Mis12 protein-domain-containing protein [Crucibulum laeve]|uniref:Mis12 protein-domain-containing protein n=1 Tax=Crucibulum laeve TaxID=68775 RepID=A0A5C3MFU8_9AGAR|nr:Mis12 protein-domain-containing protein [Crucibulum laeve]
MASSENAMPPVSPLLLCEALGFSPQLLLDDIINVANNAVQDGVNGMEEFLHKWIDERQEKLGAPTSDEEEQSMVQDIEQGLVAFQTLLEYHTDIAFDFFEAWSLRNIFYVPPGLPVVLPHQKGFNLTGRVMDEQGVEKSIEDREKELMDEVEELRAKLQDQRALKRLLMRSLHTSRSRLAMSQKRLSLLEPLRTAPTLTTLSTLPKQFESMYTTVSSLPPLDPALAVPPSDNAQPGKRLWETGETGYSKWAALSVWAKKTQISGETEDDKPVGEVGKLVEGAKEVGAAQGLRRALEVVDEVRQVLDSPSKQDSNKMEE